ncbi:MAG: hypothetical protein LEGION0398_MBIBDBAK_00469 [Legionellaceae bacterium]
MLAEILKKFTSLFSDSKTRIIAFITLLVAIIAIVIGISTIIQKMNGPLGPEATAKMALSPNIQSIPGGWDKKSSQEYVKQVEERNAQEAEKAKKEGTSAIPTITQSSAITSDLDPSKISGGVSFSTLEKLQSADPNQLKTINAKCKSIGALAFDNKGNATGTVSAGGIVKDPCNRNIGTVGDDCNIRDANGKIIGKASNISLGSAIYDPKGRLIGTVGPDGQVRDLSGKVVGKLDANGVLKDLQGKVMESGASVYNAAGEFIGTVGPDGTVRNKDGKIIGTLGPDGIVRNATGEVIGKVATTTQGIPVRNEKGELIGVVSPDGLVRDSKGNIIGKLGPDGVVRNANGEVIGKVATTTQGIPVRNEKGELIGVVGPDGFVRDSKGNIIGIVDPKTGNVLNKQGKVIGKIPPGVIAKQIENGSSAASQQDSGNAAGIIPGLPVYDKNGKVIGTTGIGGVVKDAQGNIIGTLNPDGTLRNAQGEIIAKAGTLPQNSPIFDDNGNLIGTVGSDGIVRDAKGNIIGLYDPATGTVVDNQGRVVGKSANKALQKADPLAALATSANNMGKSQSLSGIGGNATENQLLLAKQKQEQAYQAQQTQANKQQLQGLITGQANQLFTAWAPPMQQYVVANETTSTMTNTPGFKMQGSGALISEKGLANNGSNVLVKAGTIMFGVLNTAVNTDQPGPIMATIVSGKFKGAKLLGTIQRQEDKALLTFNIMNYKKLSRSQTINVVAIDPETARTALATDVDYHYWLRYGSLFAASFIQGYSNAIATSGTTTTTSLLSTTTSRPQLNPSEKLLVALGNVGTQYSTLLMPLFNKPPTVTVNSGTGVGLLFLTDVGQVK